MRHVMVTGANGLVGKSVCEALLVRGWHVRGVVRSSGAAGELPSGVEHYLMQDSSPEGWAKAIDGMDAAVHLIARTHVLHDRAGDPLGAYRGVNIDITRDLLSACAGSTVRHFVYLSSIKAVGEGGDVNRYDETTACSPVDAYGVTKLEAERLVAGLSGCGVTYSIIRPPLVYGPGVRGNFLRLLKAVEAGIPLPLGLVRNARSMIFVKNLADAVAHLLASPTAENGVYHVADTDLLSTPELIRRMAEAMGRPPRLFPVPPSLLRFAAKLVGMRGEVDRLVGSLIVDDGKIRRTLGWVPPYTTEVGVRETVHWFRHRRPG